MKRIFTEGLSFRSTVLSSKELFPFHSELLSVSFSESPSLEQLIFIPVHFGLLISLFLLFFASTFPAKASVLCTV